MNVKKPIFSVLYNNKNITNDIAKYMLSITYSDKTTGESDEVSIEMEDVDGLWKNGWYPEKGAKLTVTIENLKCGVFEIDEIELRGAPDTVTIRGMATGLTNSLRTRKSDAHENKTLKQIAQKVAQKNNLTIQGDIPDITMNRVTQNKETDLGFLYRISREFGLLFSVRDSVITFTSIFKIEDRKESFIIDKSDLMSYSLKDKADGMIKTASIKSKSAKKNEAISTNLEFEKYKKENPSYTSAPVNNQDSHVDSSRTENKQQADAKAKVIMHLAASNQQKGTISIPFNSLAIAGNNFRLTGLGLLAGKYQIKASSHRIDKSGGAISELEIKRLQTPKKHEQITRKKQKTQPNNVDVKPIGFKQYKDDLTTFVNKK